MEEERNGEERKRPSERRRTEKARKRKSGEWVRRRNCLLGYGESGDRVIALYLVITRPLAVLRDKPVARAKYRAGLCRLLYNLVTDLLTSRAWYRKLFFFRTVIKNVSFLSNIRKYDAPIRKNIGSGSAIKISSLRSNFNDVVVAADEVKCQSGGGRFRNRAVESKAKPAWDTRKWGYSLECESKPSFKLDQSLD